MPDFDSTSLAQIMREIFFHLTGNDQSDKSPEQFAKHFFKQQKRAARLRKRVEMIYKRALLKGKQVELYEIAMVYYRWIVEQGMCLETAERQPYEKVMADEHLTGHP